MNKGKSWVEWWINLFVALGEDKRECLQKVKGEIVWQPHLLLVQRNALVRENVSCMMRVLIVKLC